MHLYANPELQQIIDLQLAASRTQLTFPLIFHPLLSSNKELILEDDKFQVFSFPLLHSVPTCGFLFRERKPARNLPAPRSFAYCFDTAYYEALIPFIQGTSLLYHEATFLHEMAATAREKFHSTALEAGTIALKAGVKRLLIGHFSARYDDLGPLLNEARSVFPETILAVDGDKVDIV